MQLFVVFVPGRGLEYCNAEQINLLHEILRNVYIYIYIPILYDGVS